MMDRIQRLRRENGGRLPLFAWPGGYPIIYWVEQDRWTFPLCGECAEEQLAGAFGDVGTVVGIESGDAYEEDTPCDNCGTQLAAYYEEGQE